MVIDYTKMTTEKITWNLSCSTSTKGNNNVGLSQYNPAHVPTPTPAEFEFQFQLAAYAA